MANQPAADVVFEVSPLGPVSPHGLPACFTWDRFSTYQDAYNEMVTNLRDIATAKGADIVRIYTYVINNDESYYDVIASVEFYDRADAIDTISQRVEKSNENVQDERFKFLQETSQHVIAALISRSDKNVKDESLARISEVACTVAGNITKSLYDHQKPEHKEHHDI